MSVMQLVFLRCNGSRGLLYSVTSQANSIGTINRNVTLAVNACRFPSGEKKLKHPNRFQAVKQAKSDISKDSFTIKTHRKLRHASKISSGEHASALNRQNQERAKDHIIIKSEWLPVRDGLFYNSTNFQNEHHPATNSLVHTNQFTCSAKDDNSDKSEGNNNSKVPNEDTLENTAAILLKELSGIFVKSPEYQIYRSDIVFENRIKDKVSFDVYTTF